MCSKVSLNQIIFEVFRVSLVGL